MANVISGVLGVDLNNPSATQLFTLNQKVLGTDDTQWTYIYATASLVTGQIVQIMPAGTANVLTTALVNAATGGLDLGFAQFTVSAGYYGFVAKAGRNLYVLCTGTTPPAVSVGLAGTGGVLVTAGLVAATMQGIYITTSAQGLTPTVGVATITFPRFVTSIPLS